MFSKIINGIYGFGCFLMCAWVSPSLLIPIAVVSKVMGHKIQYGNMNIRFWFGYIDTKFERSNNDQKQIENGFILSNHRGQVDGIIDSYVCRNIIISRHMATLALLPICILYQLDGRHISINRNRSRQDTFMRIIDYMKTHQGPVLFYPEGTRRRYSHLSSLDECKQYMKPGLIKSIYEHKKLPVQLLISNNKEFVFNETTMTVNHGVTITSWFSQPIYPEDYTTFDDFYREICEQWFTNWLSPTFTQSSNKRM